MQMYVGHLNHEGSFLLNVIGIVLFDFLEFLTQNEVEVASGE